MEYIHPDFNPEDIDVPSVCQTIINMYSLNESLLITPSVDNEYHLVLSWARCVVSLPTPEAQMETLRRFPEEVIKLLAWCLDRYPLTEANADSEGAGALKGGDSSSSDVEGAASEDESAENVVAREGETLQARSSSMGCVIAPENHDSGSSAMFPPAVSREVEDGGISPMADDGGNDGSGQTGACSVLDPEKQEEEEEEAVVESVERKLTAGKVIGKKGCGTKRKRHTGSPKDEARPTEEGKGKEKVLLRDQAVEEEETAAPPSPKGKATRGDERPTKKLRHRYNQYPPETAAKIARLLAGWKEHLVRPSGINEGIGLVHFVDGDPLPEVRDGRQLVERIRTDVHRCGVSAIASVRAYMALGRDLEAAFRRTKKAGKLWPEWVERCGISSSYANKLRRLYRALGPFPVFQFLAVPIRHLLEHADAIAHMLARKNRRWQLEAEYWRRARCEAKEEKRRLFCDNN